ncbi:MAG: ribosomal protein S18-alanine N-acetyltransferase [Zoogloeaceae bacterium]|jgi:ribosomal-protein-alanine acetyltransferase|nr:ribosomal protein S18-alanine N-acetyltransferase [Zoogloeaceae bacterium]
MTSDVTSGAAFPPFPLILPETFPLSEEDLAWLAALEARTERFPWKEQHFADSLRMEYDAWGLRRGAERLGFVLLQHAPDSSHLLKITVASEARRQGLGARLLQHAMQRAAQAGNEQIFLEVRPSNPVALALYRRFGFQEVGRRRGYYPADGVGQREDALVLRATLSPRTRSP